MEATPAMGRNGEDTQTTSVLPQYQGQSGAPAIPDEDVERAQLYGLLARALTEPMSDETLELVRALDGAGDESELGRAISSLGAMAVRTPRGAAEEEFSKLFFGMGSGGTVSPYGSQYLTGFVYDKPLAKLRADMNALGIEASGVSKEPEDHIAYICETMHALITGRYGAPADLATQRTFFETHVAPWAGRFFTELEGAEAAALYMPVGTIGRLFLQIEAEAFSLVA